MSYTKKVLKLIEQAANEERRELDLSGHKLTTLPPEFRKLTKLTSLDLGDNRLKSLPPEITKLSSLKRLDLGFNGLTNLPLGIKNLVNLTSLNLSNNDFRSLPPAIGNLTGLNNLDLSFNSLNDLPSNVAKLSHLTTLNISVNELVEMPSVITKLTKLKSLNLGYNKLRSAPEGLTKLTCLTELHLGDIGLTDLPSVIGKLTRLTTLDISFNRLKTVSLEIKKLAKLINLRDLQLYDIGLPSLPPEITELKNLTSLNLGGNQITSISQEIAKLPNLTLLYLHNNQLSALPPSIAKLSRLEVLHLAGNRFTVFPPEIMKLKNLTNLTIRDNKLTSVPGRITELPNLIELDLSGNQLPIPPETLANSQDLKAIFAAIAGLGSGERLNEAKMLVVGDGDVGKRSVVEQLIYGTFNPEKRTTLGVEINDEMKVLQSVVTGQGEPVKLNIWDFGGQEIQHSTHQFFLTTRSLYLLVVDARKGDQLNNIEYWLKLIESFGGDSPIIIVINQIDQLEGQRALNLDRKALQDKYNVRHFVETSCETGEGIPALKMAIAREVEQLKHVRDFWPREWIAIKHRLKDMQADYIPVETYLEICSEENLNDEDLRQSLLDILHVLGTVVRFPGDTQVLNPRWVTQGVYGLLTSAQLVRDQGQFDLKDVSKILANLSDADHYPPHTHRRLIEVMQHFQLCFEFTDRPGHYLIPRHLHDNELDIPWDDSDGLKFQYHYETLPDSIISRFIVRMNQYITKQYYWKNGVFLHSGENRARVKADLVDRKIFISIIGKEHTRRAFLAVIRSAFEEINSNFKIEIEQKIPVPGFPQALVSYKELLVYEEMNEPQILIPELRNKFSVRELLDGVEELGARLKRRMNESGRVPPRRPEETQVKRQPRVLRIIVASPSDVQPERDALPSVIEEINRGVAADRGLHLVLSRWETDTYPGFHSEGPQGLIDPILNIADCDLLIGIFWKRFGTPTADAKSGTEHELNLAHQAWKEKGSPQIFVYFNEKSYAPKSKAETEQWGQVLEFKEKFPKEGLWWPYKGKAQFEKLIRNHLTNYIRTLT